MNPLCFYQTTYYLPVHFNVATLLRRLAEGGCENFDSISTENPVRVLDDQDYTLETCAAVCEELEWCTHVFIGITNSRCIPVGDGCTQNSDRAWAYYRVSSMNTGASGRHTLELTETAWDHAGAVEFGEETTLACGQNCGQEVWMQSRDTFTRPVSVTAEIKADGPECITMSLFADSHEKNAPYSIETGGWRSKIRCARRCFSAYIFDTTTQSQQRSRS